ncbi:MAG TPA: ABC transporter permease [Candidatus Dormibacteraeota bacterium]|nr:ABC transporter permease [Candidatus Dormibacteraeota bacterium]
MALAPRLFQYVSLGFFHTMGTRLIAGRELTWTDVYRERKFALVSENLARELWGTPAAALHKRFRGPVSQWWEVIGVVQDVRENGIDQKAPPTVYWPTLTSNIGGPGPALDAIRTATFAIRSDRAGRKGFLDQVQRAVWSVNSELPVATVRTM